MIDGEFSLDCILSSMRLAECRAVKEMMKPNSVEFLEACRNVRARDFKGDRPD
jgi:hypothetical protein